MTKDSSTGWSLQTIAAQALGAIDEDTRGIIPPIHLSTTYLRDPDNQYRRGLVYGRPDNATIREVESVMAALEGAKAAMVLGSGLSAAAALFLSFKPKDHIIAPKIMYWGLRNWLVNEARELGLDVELVDTTDLNAVQKAMRPGATKLVWLETPANPLWSVSDIRAIADIAHQYGARVAVDSTCATPFLTRPLALGADWVMHSATKYLNGHSDVVAGVIATQSIDDLWMRIVHNRTALGQILGPFEAYLLLRGLRTLPLRIATACTNAMELAQRLSKHSAIAEVLYPGLVSHPGHDIAARQMSGGFGGMLSIRLRGGERAAIATAARVKLWKRATSLGGVESLIEHRGSVEGPASPCPLDLLRLSPGIESIEDLWCDLDQALQNESTTV